MPTANPPALRRQRLEDMHKAMLKERRLALAAKSANEPDAESVAGSTTSAAADPAASATTGPATGPAAAPVEPVSQAASRGNYRGAGGWYSGGKCYGHNNRGWRSNHRGYGYRGRVHTYWDHPAGGSRGAGYGPRDYQGPPPTAPRCADPPVPPAAGGSRPPAPPMPHGGPGQAWKQWTPNTKPRTEYQVEDLDDEMMTWRVENGLDKPRQKDDTMDYEQGS
ncbi:hypothetical protein G7054_g1411 [Neopestalotiopsis clavispora]|nr:hypothetical protein G7054_g1411 [Neopestalotiopsis clavispora]